MRVGQRRLGRCGTPGAALIPGGGWLCVGHARIFIAGIEGEIDLAEHRLGIETSNGRYAGVNLGFELAETMQNAASAADYARFVPAFLAAWVGANDRSEGGDCVTSLHFDDGRIDLLRDPAADVPQVTWVAGDGGPARHEPPD